MKKPLLVQTALMVDANADTSPRANQGLYKPLVGRACPGREAYWLNALHLSVRVPGSIPRFGTNVRFSILGPCQDRTHADAMVPRGKV